MTVFFPQEHWFIVKHAFDSKAGWTGQDFLNGRPRQRQKRVLKFSQVCTRSLIDGLTGLRAAAYVGSAYGHFEETDSPVIPFRRPVQVVRIIERAGLLKSILFCNVVLDAIVTNHR